MDKEQLDKLDLQIRESIFNPDDYPCAKKSSEFIGYIFKTNFDKSDEWISEQDYLSVIQKVIRNSGDNELLVLEDFERKYKSSGEVVRLSDSFGESWSEFKYFADSTDIISFFSIGNSQDWLIWANRDYWCILFKKSAISFLELGITHESNVKAFKEADDKFVSFVDDLFS